VRGVFVVGTDTGVGKTVLSAALLAASAQDVVYAKPIQTGSPPDDDVATVRGLASVPPERAPDLGTRLLAPVSPHHAALLEAKRLGADLLAAPLLRGDRPGRRWIVEGAGGLLVPLSVHETLADLVRVLGLPAVIAVGVRLGAINHTLLTLSALERRGLACLGVVLVGDQDPSLESALAAHARGAVLGRLPRLQRVTTAAVREAGAALLAGSAALREALA
jgi:dethiobiotin synthase